MNRPDESPIEIIPRVDRRDKKYRYLDKGRMTATVRNNMPCSIRVIKSEMQFKHRGRKTTFSGSDDVEIPPNGTSEISIDFKIGPWATLLSNSFGVHVEYMELAREKPVQKPFTGPFNNFVLTERAEPSDKTVFISHSNSERDLALVEGVYFLLDRLGFTPYVAEYDRRPGLPLWKKIQDKIRSSDLFLVLYTEDGSGSCDVREEVGMAVGMGKEIIPVADGDSTAGSISGREYVPLDRNRLDESIVEVCEQVLRAAERRRPGS